jgi:superfamily II DNA or RNA helicase
MRVDSIITLGWNELPEARRKKLLRQLTFPVGDQTCTCYRLHYGAAIEMPRGAWQFVDDLNYIDKRSKPNLPALSFNVQLDNTAKDQRFAGQKDAVDAMLRYEQGIILRPPGTGKSNIALAFAARARTRTLVIVHTKDILNQWLDYIRDSMPEVEPGVIASGSKTVGHITIGTIQTLHRQLGNRPDEWWAQWGAVVVDEGHHSAADTYEKVLNNLPAHYRFGFTATDKRADGLHPYLPILIGPVIHKQKFTSPIELKVKPVYTDFRYPYRGRWDWHDLLNALVTDERRNGLIADIIDRETAGGNSILVLSRRIEHLRRIADHLQYPAEVLTGEHSVADRRRVLRDFKEGRIKCLLATQLADEALDVPRCNRVMLTYPGKHEGRIVQQIGRTLRQHPGKENARIFDIVDRRIGVLNFQWKQRKQTYHKLRIPIIKRKLVWR